MLKLSTGVMLAMGAPLWVVVSAVFRAVIAAIVAVVRTVLVVVWWALRLLGRHAMKIIIAVAVTAFVCVLTITIYVLAMSISAQLTEWKASHDTKMEATKEEGAFSEAMDAAAEEAERLQIRQRVMHLVNVVDGGLGWTIDDRSITFSAPDIWCIVVLDGMEIYRHAATHKAPIIYRGMGEWEHMIDAIETWATRTERENRFGGIEES